MLCYLSSQQFGNEITILQNWIQTHDNKILLIFNALDAKGEEKILFNTKEDKKLLEKIGFDVTVMNLRDYFGKPKKLENEFLNYPAYCVMGGNVFVLRQAMKYSGFDTFLKQISSNPNYLYIGYSAGSCVLSNDLKELAIADEPLSFYEGTEVFYDGIGLIPYLFIPHYQSCYHKSYLIDQVVETCKKKNIKFQAVKDGEVIVEELKSS